MYTPYNGCFKLYTSEKIISIILLLTLKNYIKKKFKWKERYMKYEVHLLQYDGVGR